MQNLFSKPLIRTTRLRKINDLRDKIIELEEQKIMHMQSPEYFKVLES